MSISTDNETASTTGLNEQSHAAASAAHTQNTTVGGGRWTRNIVARCHQLALACFVLVCADVAGALFFGSYRGDSAAAAASALVLAAAQQGSSALLTYTPDSLDRDLATARSQLTGDFLTYYSQFTDQFVVPAVKQKDIHATATVVRAAAVDVHPGTAQVLIFLNQTTTSRDNPVPVQTASSVKVGLTKVEGNWRISSFDPV